MKFLFLFLLFQTQLLAADMEKCLSQAEGFKNKNDIDKECIELVKASASMMQKSFSKKITAFAYKNLLYIQNLDTKVFTLSGEKTSLTDIVSIKISPDEKWISVIDQKAGQKEILVFPTNRNGNIAPHKVYSGPEFKNVVDIAFSITEHKIYFLDNKLLEVFAIDENSDSRMLLDTKKPIILKKISKEHLALKRPSQIEVGEKTLLVLDESEQKMAILNLAETSESQIQDSLSVGLNGIVSKIRLKESENEIELYGQDELDLKKLQIEDHGKAKPE